MAELVGGAVLGTALSSLCDNLTDLIGKNQDFDSILEKSKSTLYFLKSELESGQMIQYYSDGKLQGLEEVIKNGSALVGKCLVKKPWKWNPVNPIRTCKYANQLLKWDESLDGELRLLNLKGNFDVRKAAISLTKIEAAVQKNADRDESEAETSKAILELLKSLVAGSEKNEAYCAVPELPPLTVGLDIHLNELKKKMFQDGNSMIVVSAMGGAGKTTLAIKFCHDQEVRETFKNNIFFITISKKVDLMLIVQQLYQRKGLKAPAVTNEESAATSLEKFVMEESKRGPLLLVLDDVWVESAFRLKKFRCEGLKVHHKILLTSRSKLNDFGFQYCLPLLNASDSKKLFRHSASLGNESPDVLELSDKITTYCEGLPLAITVVGASLLDQPVETWRGREIELSKGDSIIASESELYDCLQKSLDALDKKTTKCFLDLGAFPEHKRISVGALIDMWAELYSFMSGCKDSGGLTYEVEDTMCITKLERLKSRNLANLVDTRKDKIEKDGYYNGHYVSLHDLLKDLATHCLREDPVEKRKRLIINILGNDIPKWWRNGKWRKQKDPRMQARLFSLSTDSVFSKKLPNIPLPETEVLILNFQSRKYFFPEFVEDMRELKVLLVRYDDSSYAMLDDFQLVGSLPSLKRIRLERISIWSITEKPFRLQSLVKMSLILCDLRRAFSNSCLNISDAFPKLQELNIDDCCNLNEFLTECCDLVHLTKLSITNCHGVDSLPEGIGRLVNLKVLRLRSCKNLSRFPDSVTKLKALNFLDISDCSSIGALPKNFGEMSSLRKLDMRRCKFMELPPSVLYLKKLEEVICSQKGKYKWEAVNPSLLSIVAMPPNWSDFLD